MLVNAVMNDATALMMNIPWASTRAGHEYADCSPTFGVARDAVLTYPSTRQIVC